MYGSAVGDRYEIMGVQGGRGGHARDIRGRKCAFSEIKSREYPANHLRKKWKNCRSNPEDSEIRKAGNSRELLLGLCEHDVSTPLGKWEDKDLLVSWEVTARQKATEVACHVKGELFERRLGLCHSHHIG